MTGEIVIRWAPSENVLRSTGDPPGVLVLAFPGGHPSLAIDRGWEPHMAPPGTTTADWFEEGISPLAEPVDVETAVAACFDREAVTQLYGLAAQTFHAGVQVLLGAQQFDVMRELVDLIEDLAAAIDRRLEETS